MPDPNPNAATPVSDPVRLARWTVQSGSNARSRGAVILDAGDHHWRASAEGNGAIDALVIGRFLLMKDYWLLRSQDQ